MFCFRVSERCDFEDSRPGAGVVSWIPEDGGNGEANKEAESDFRDAIIDAGLRVWDIEDN